MPRLYKSQKLCSKIAIDALFARGGGKQSFIAYPLRAVWRQNPAPSPSAPALQFFISIPKKRLRHAVDLVKMRRRVREALRLALPALNLPAGAAAQMGLVYVADALMPYADITHAVERILKIVARSYEHD